MNSRGDEDRRTAHTVRKEDTGNGIINLIYLIGIAFSLARTYMCVNGDTYLNSVSFYFFLLGSYFCDDAKFRFWDYYAKMDFFVGGKMVLGYEFWMGK